MSCADFRQAVASAPHAVEALNGEGREHLLACAACRELLLGRALVEGAPEEEGDDSRCVTTERLAGFLDGTLGSEGREAVAAHLVACRTCRTDMVELADALSGTREDDDLVRPPSSVEKQAARLAVPVRGGRVAIGPWPLRIAVPLAAAAALGVVATGLGVRDLIDRGGTAGPGSGQSVLRGAADDAPALVEPRGEVPAGSRLRFAWRSAPVVAGPAETGRYRLIVSDLDRGIVVLDLEVEGTSRDLSASEQARILAGIHYHWMLRPEAGTPGEPSETASFTLTPTP